MKSEARNQDYSNNTRIYRVFAFTCDFCSIVFSSWNLKKVEESKVLQCFSLDLVVRNVCCSMVAHTRVVSKQWKNIRFHGFYLTHGLGCAACSLHALLTNY
jgi:hypothetical protein